MKIEKAYWLDHKPSDDNKGYIYGIYYIDEDLDETIECEWFKTRQERNQKYKIEERRGEYDKEINFRASQ